MAVGQMPREVIRPEDRYYAVWLVSQHGPPGRQFIFSFAGTLVISRDRQTDFAYHGTRSVAVSHSGLPVSCAMVSAISALWASS